jgi:hypothetical protein
MSIKISALTSAATIQGVEELPVVQSTETKKTTVEALLTKPLIEIDLSGADFPVSTYGIYYITTGSSGLTPNTIMLPDPTTMPGAELLFFNYDQTNGADFAGSYQPLLEASTSSGDKYVSIPLKQAVKVVSVNGYWSALSYKL